MMLRYFDRDFERDSFSPTMDAPTFEEERRILDKMAFTVPENKVKQVVTLDGTRHDNRTAGTGIIAEPVVGPT